MVISPRPFICCLMRPPRRATFSCHTTFGVVPSSCTMKLCGSSTPTADEGNKAPLMRARVSSVSASVFGRSRVRACRSDRIWARVLPSIAWRASSSSCARISSRSGASLVGFACAGLLRRSSRDCAVANVCHGQLSRSPSVKAVYFLVVDFISFFGSRCFLSYRWPVRLNLNLLCKV